MVGVRTYHYATERNIFHPLGGKLLKSVNTPMTRILKWHLFLNVGLVNDLNLNILKLWTTPHTLDAFDDNGKDRLTRTFEILCKIESTTLYCIVLEDCFLF